MYPFFFDEVRAEMHRREDNLRRAQLNGTAYEYRPKRHVSWPWLWRKSARSNEAPAQRSYGPGSGEPAAGTS
jgi:hypothetical protein